ncbi:MAG: xanthine dehydrogenase family protein molybdopterin-binding subunit, partial [Anaerolineae bacterium]
HANAKILDIDTSAAERLPGVRAILTYKNAGKQRWDHERPVFKAYVRLVGDDVAAVAADTEQVADDALKLIKVKYEVLPHIIDPLEAMRPGAPKLHPYGNIWKGKPSVYERGDINKGFAEADVVIEQTYTTSEQHHACLEMHGCVAHWRSGMLTVWDSTQGVHLARDLMALKLRLPISKVRVLSDHTGGGFGSKNGVKEYHIIAAMLTRKTGRPVRLFLDRFQDFLLTSHRPSTIQKIKGGFKKDGTLTAMDYEVIGRGGVWNTRNMRWASSPGESTRGLYRCPNLRTTGYSVHTNLSVPGACRGPGNTENLFALEQFMDEAAEKLNVDPIELRVKNYTGIYQIKNEPYFSKGLKESYEAAAKAFGWKRQKPASVVDGTKRRGIGMGSVFWHGYVGEPSQALVTVYPEGTAEVNVGIANLGVGAQVAFAQIAAEELAVPLDKVRVSYGDSAGTPYSINSSYGSRTTFQAGPAVRMAAADAKQQLIGIAAGVLKVPAADVQYKDGVFSAKSDPTKKASLKDITGKMGWFKKRHLVIGKGKRLANPKGRKVDIFGAHFAEVEVDTVTGNIKVLRAVCAHDSGRPINALMYESQVQGGFVMGLGMALYEERIIDTETGIQLNGNYHEYGCPTALDVPDEVKVIPIETHDPSNNVNVKGLGEPPVTGAGGAIANAIFNAIGVRIRDYPITPSKILDALRTVG